MGGDERRRSEVTKSRTMDDLLAVLRLSDQRELYQRGFEQGEAAGEPVEMLVNAWPTCPVSPGWKRCGPAGAWWNC
jgi:hypothetical protein